MDSSLWAAPPRAAPHGQFPRGQFPWAVPWAWLWQVLAGVSSPCPGGVDVHPASWATQRDVSLKLAAAPSVGASPCTGVRGGCAAGCTHPAGGAPGPGSPCGSGLLSELGGGHEERKASPKKCALWGRRGGWGSASRPGATDTSMTRTQGTDTCAKSPELHGTTPAPTRGARSGVFSPVLFHKNTE